MKRGYSLIRAKRGRVDSRVWNKERDIIFEETLFLIGLGYKEDNKNEIITGMALAYKHYEPSEWIKICDETLRWHCKNFYELGKKHGKNKEIDRSYIFGIKKRIDSGL